MRTRFLPLLGVALAVGLLTFGPLTAGPAQAAPSAREQLLTGRIEEIDRDRDRPLVRLRNEADAYTVRFANRARVAGLNVGDVISVRAERDDDDDVFDAIRIELLVRIDRDAVVSRQVNVDRSDRQADKRDRQADKEERKLEHKLDKAEDKLEKFEDKFEERLDKLEDQFERQLDRLEDQIDDLEDELD